MSQEEGFLMDPNRIFDSSHYALSKWIAETAVLRASTFK
jgi:hypothetical protein